MATLEHICRAVFITAVLLGFPVAFAALYCWALAWTNMRREMKWRAHFMGPLLFFLPSFYNETGNIYRKRFLLLMLCFLLLVAIGFLIALFCGTHQWKLSGQRADPQGDVVSEAILVTAKEGKERNVSLDIKRYPHPQS